MTDVSTPTQPLGGKRKREKAEMTESDESPEVTADEQGPPQQDPPEEDSADKKPERSRSTVVLIGLAVALVVAVSGLIAWNSAASSDDLETANARDAVLVAATHGIETLNTLSYEDIDGGLKKWVSVSTGTFADQFASINADTRKLLAEQKKNSEGKVLDAAVINLEKNTATVIAAVEVTVADGTDKTAEPVVKRNRFSADMVLVKGSWKVENLQQVAVTLQ